MIVTGDKFAASGGKLQAGLGSNGFWHQENRTRRKGGSKGTLKTFLEQGQSAGAIKYHLGCFVHASYIDYRELRVAVLVCDKMMQHVLQ